MKYISIDIETTGLNVETASVLMISLIFVDTSHKHPKKSAKPLTFMIDRNLDRLQWDAKALEMNQWILDCIQGKRQTKYSIIPIQHVMMVIENALIDNGYEKNKEGKYEVNFAGANLATFDLPLLRNDIVGFEELIHSNRRVLDPSIIFVDYDADQYLPGLSKTLERAGMNKLVAHDSQLDAFQIIDLLEYHRLSRKPLMFKFLKLFNNLFSR